MQVSGSIQYSERSRDGPRCVHRFGSVRFRPIPRDSFAASASRGEAPAIHSLVSGEYLAAVPFFFTRNGSRTPTRFTQRPAETILNGSLAEGPARAAVARRPAVKPSSSFNPAQVSSSLSTPVCISASLSTISLSSSPSLVVQRSTSSFNSGNSLTSY